MQAWFINYFKVFSRLTFELNIVFYRKKRVGKKGTFCFSSPTYKEMTDPTGLPWREGQCGQPAAGESRAPVSHRAPTWIMAPDPRLFNHHPPPKLFSSCQTDTLYPANSTTSSHLPQLLATIIITLSVFMILTNLGASCKWNRSVFVHFWLLYFT